MSKGSGSGSNGSYGNEQATAETTGGRTDIYYGGSGGPLGPGHGHIVQDSSGNTTYHRGSASEGGDVFYDNK